MTVEQLDEIERAWAPLAGNDTNGPHTKTANTIMALLGHIKAQSIVTIVNAKPEDFVDAPAAEAKEDAQ